MTCGKTGREFLLQALDRESRDSWGIVIERQIQYVQKDLQNVRTGDLYLPEILQTKL